MSDNQTLLENRKYIKDRYTKDYMSLLRFIEASILTSRRHNHPISITEDLESAHDLLLKSKDFVDNAIYDAYHYMMAEMKKGKI